MSEMSEGLLRIEDCTAKRKMNNYPRLKGDFCLSALTWAF